MCKGGSTISGTLTTELAEGGVGDQTIMDIAGHVSKQMLKHWSHTRMKAKREALESVVKPASASNSEGTSEQQACDPLRVNEQKVEGESLKSGDFQGHRQGDKACKSLKRIGSSGRIRTYNPSVNS